MNNHQETKEKIIQLAETNSRILGLELWGVEYFPGPGGKKGIVRIFVDSDQGVSIDECAELSRQISVVLDVEDIVPGSYTLEVSSPGIDRIFFHPFQMEKFIGQKLKVTLNQPRQGRKNYSGSLIKVEKNRLVIQSESGDSWDFDWDDAEKIRLTG
ncbi:ribosome maturation factor RimP [Desulfonatronovibrio hydrogenovorans]|uniref:ribosome maturation factor RimP n=1 Tax=Desulfonatronovibrio hydrogenovorans TaxID=53245 RepID=UPI00055905E7|nr:ribosome maturation factor RimP [Desulfonatronovibrio hydrogenovorans]